jgi:hypothetical protein
MIALLSLGYKQLVPLFPNAQRMRLYSAKGFNISYRKRIHPGRSFIIALAKTLLLPPCSAYLK